MNDTEINQDRFSDDVLREAFELGADWAVEREYVRDGHIRPSEAVCPDFPTWLASLKERLVA